MTEERGQYAVTVHQPITPNRWEMIKAIAPEMYRSRLFGLSSPEQGMAIMLAGYELGIGLVASFEFIKVIQGKPTLIPRGALALVLNSPLCAGVDIKDEPDACTVTMKRANGFNYTIRYTIDDAKRAGLVKDGSGWQKYQANMLRWITVGFCADVVFPDVIGGMKRADESGAAISADGEVLDGAWAVVPAQPTQPAITLDSLIERWGAEAILAANDGRIPSTDEEVKAVWELLKDA